MKKENKKIIKKKILDYDFSKDNIFGANLKLGPNSPIININGIELKIEHEGNLTFDDVFLGVDAEIEKHYSIESYPNIKVVEYLVFCKDTKKWYQVVSESDKDKISSLKKSKEYDRFLALPDATYSLTPECKLWMAMKDQGLCSEDSMFDYKTMHELIKSLN